MSLPPQGVSIECPGNSADTTVSGALLKRRYLGGSCCASLLSFTPAVAKGAWKTRLCESRSCSPSCLALQATSAWTTLNRAALRSAASHLRRQAASRGVSASSLARLASHEVARATPLFARGLLYPREGKACSLADSCRCRSFATVHTTTSFECSVSIRRSSAALDSNSKAKLLTCAEEVEGQLPQVLAKVVLHSTESCCSGGGAGRRRIGCEAACCAVTSAMRALSRSAASSFRRAAASRGVSVGSWGVSAWCALAHG